MKKIQKKSIGAIQQQKPSQGISDQNFKIFLRIKPTQSQQPNNQILKILSQNKVEIVSPYYTVNQVQKVYSYEQVFDDTINNQKIFQQTMINPITNVLQGYNSTVFIYGMTGSGKTYTMFGSIGNGTSYTCQKNQEDGLVPMTVDYIFNQIQKQTNVKSQILVSFYQIYNQNIRDLLQQQQSSLNIMQDPIRGVFINGLQQVIAQDKNQIKDVISCGLQRRAMNATRSNQVSSRSHAILQFIVKRYINVNNHQNLQSQNDSQTVVLQSKFFMIDLAGNQKTSNNESRRFIQGVNINKSLLTLGKCLSILSQKKSTSVYVPFRDSKLTRILKQSLGGNSKTIMIACVSWQKRFYQQTLNTLKYSSIAKKIKNKSVRNNVKVISKQEVPDSRNFINNGTQNMSNIRPEMVSAQQQNKVKRQLQQLMVSIQSKLRIQRLQQDLQTSRKQNQQLLKLQKQEIDGDICRSNIRKINQTLQQLMRPYEKHLQKLQASYHNLMECIYEIVTKKQKQRMKEREKQKQKQRSNKQNLSKQHNIYQNQLHNHQEQINNLRQIITSQNCKISELQQKLAGQNENNNSISVNECQSNNLQMNANRSIEKRQLRLASPNIYPNLNMNINLMNSPALHRDNSILSLQSSKNHLNCSANISVNSQYKNVGKNDGSVAANLTTSKNMNSNSNLKNVKNHSISLPKTKAPNQCIGLSISKNPFSNQNININSNLNSSSSIHKPKNKSKGKKLTLNLIDNEETFSNSVQNFHQFTNTNTNRSQCSLGSLGEKKNSFGFYNCNNSNSNSSINGNAGQNITGSKISNVLQKQIVINLTNQKIEKQKKSYESSKEEFIKRLKQTEKKVKGGHMEQIHQLLKQQQQQRYELGNVEMSMIRKLKFFQRQNSLEKSSSLSKQMHRTQEPIRFISKKF